VHAVWPTQPPIQWVPGPLSQGRQNGWHAKLIIHLHMVLRARIVGTVQGNTGGKVSILGGDSISPHGKNNARMNVCLDLHDYVD
jgi:hypothetical protein